MNEQKYTWQDLLDIMKKLRSEDGCPWDIEQTHQTLKKYLLEETYEVMDAIDKNNPQELCEELGDLLLQVVFHAQIASDNSTFNIEDIIHSISQKMVSRHQHVFGKNKLNTADDVVNVWEIIKKKEKGNKTHQDVLSQIPKNLPSLIRAYKVQQKAALVGFDWDEISDVWNKVYEEINELKEVLENDNKIQTKNTKLKNSEKTNKNLNEEIGDCIFALVNLARFLDIHPEFAVTSTTEKFIKRFGFIEQEAQKKGLNLEDMSLEEMDKFWEESKK